MAEALRMARRIALISVGVTHLLLMLGGALSSVGLTLAAMGLALAASLALALLYFKRLAQWRAILVAWLAYAALWPLSQLLAGVASSPLLQAVATLAVVLALEAMLTALTSIAALAICRDVSVAYVALAYGAGAFLMLQLIRSTGGVLNFFLASADLQSGPWAVVIGPLMLTLSCMATFGFLSFFPHLLWMAWREIIGR
jgi:hypothetical protein